MPNTLASKTEIKAKVEADVYRIEDTHIATPSDENQVSQLGNYFVAVVVSRGDSVTGKKLDTFTVKWTNVTATTVFEILALVASGPIGAEGKRLIFAQMEDAGEMPAGGTIT